MTDQTTSVGIGTEFMRLTKPAHLVESQQSQELPQPPLEAPYDVTGRIHELPAPDALDLPEVNLRDVITDRRTVRRYRDEALTQVELSYLLWCTQGVKPESKRSRTFRTVPSAGARHAFETVLLINNVEGLQPGLYRYLASAHKLVTLNLAEDIADRLADACMNQPQVAHGAVTFFWVAITERMFWRYGERGYRYLHLDAGHVCQNLYLAAGPIECGVCAIAAFYDDELNALLDLDGESQFVIYLASLGKMAR